MENNLNFEVEKLKREVWAISKNSSESVTLDDNVSSDSSNGVKSSGIYSAIFTETTARENADSSLQTQISAKANSSDIPTVNNVIITVTNNGSSVGTFTTNQSSNQSIDLGASSRGIARLV